MDTDQISEASSDKPISLPEPDTENITVLTKELPNEPILPWHRFDSPWLEGEEKDKDGDEKDEAEAQPDSASNQTDVKEASGNKAETDKAEETDKTETDKAETLLVELKEKIEAEIELLEQSEPEAQSAEPIEEVEEIAELARELVSKLEAKKAVKTETPAPAPAKPAETQLDRTPVGDSEDMIEERDEVE